MEGLMFNAVLRAVDPQLSGLYRVVAVPPDGLNVWLAFIGPCDDVSDEATTGEAEVPPLGALLPVARSMLADLDAAGKLFVVEVRSSARLRIDPEDLRPRELALLQRRQALLAVFLDHARLCDSLERTGGIGVLVREAMKTGEGSRALVYRLLQLLFLHGFEVSSLVPRFDRCGAPGVLRPVTERRKKAGAKNAMQRIGEPDPTPQGGVTDADRIKILAHYRSLARPGKSFRHLYAQLVLRLYVTRYEDSGAGRVPIMPPEGTFPNMRQVRHIIDSGTRRLERARRRTTQGYFERSKRALRGRSYDHSPGPGHLYAIDATVGDIHLRSALKPAWPIGRPVVYLVVDVWSTAIVGFYAALSAPSWANARLALFSTLCAPELLAELWGLNPADALIPAPAVPAEVLTDRGEYVSAAARETCGRLGINLAVNPAYRPELKGMVEVLHRITKDDQFGFVPGAINARRRELELKPSAKESALTLREYVQYLYLMIAHYNLHADRSKRMTAEMIAAGVDASPSGLWQFGHEAGFGYRKALPADRLIADLLSRSTAVVRRDGVFFESLQYDGDIASSEEWTGQARNFGAFERTVYHFPGSTSRFWCPGDDGGLHPFHLRPNARVPSEFCLDEWRDLLMYEHMKKGTRQFRRVKALMQRIHQQQEIFKRAEERRTEAEAAESGPQPTVREVRLLEQSAKTLPTDPPEPSSNEAPQPPDYDAYEELMDGIFRDLNRGGESC
ncbi:DDE-type integrase/transposase/recombinase [Thiomonas sp. FB-6]|uniref:DDE-type integrase/transposase/recombinase n=1 Tax=Thiomonas sp. FB-6 TaxID=1158291 RepID=UPI0009DBD150|nr:DDE-type integrase/transposase/recombinase [Thiomonas sp. FB-6]